MDLNFMFQTNTIVVQKNTMQHFFEYAKVQCSGAKLTKNATIFRYRQLFFALSKNYQNLSEHEQEVVDEFNTYTSDKYGKIEDSKYLPSPAQVQYLYEQSHNPDYYNSDMSVQTGRQIINEVYDSFKSFFAEIKDYWKHSLKYTGKPNIPHYIKSNETEVSFTNQDCRIYEFDGITYLKMPTMPKIIGKQTKYGKKGYLPLGKLKLKGNLMQVKIQPYYDTYKIFLICKVELPLVNLNKLRILGIDPGLNNFLTTSNNCGLHPFIIDGKEMKSYNQHYNETLSRLRSRLPKNVYSSEQIQRLSRRRDCYFHNKFHQIIHYIISYCQDHNIGTIVYGHNKFQKQNSDIGSVQNQHFCFMPNFKFLKMLKLQCTFWGIQVIETEESYTSKASFLDMDDIPVYGQVNGVPIFSGKRKYRGLYITNDGTKINADVNAASNIIRKVFPNAFQNVNDVTYLTETVYKIKI